MKRTPLEKLTAILKDLTAGEKQELLMRSMMYEIASLCDTDAEFIASLEEQKSFCLRSLDYCIAATRAALETKLETN